MSCRHAAGQNRPDPEQAVCLKVLSFWNWGLLVQLFIRLSRVHQGLLAPAQCQIQAYVGWIEYSTCMPSLRALTSSTEFMEFSLSLTSWENWRRWRGSMRVAPVRMTFVWLGQQWDRVNICFSVSDLQSLGLWIRKGLVSRQSSAGECSAGDGCSCKPASLEVQL